MGGQIVQDNANSICLGKVHIAEFAHANGEVLRGPPVGDLYLTPGSVGVEKDEQVDRPVASILAVIALMLPRHGRDRLPYLTDELGRALVETDNRALRIRRLRIQVEHILHSSDVLAVDMRNAPPVLAPRLEVVFGQPTAHCFPGDAVVLGESDQFIRQQLQGPTGATLRWVGTGGRDQQGFLFSREFAGRARTRLFAQCLFQIAHHEAALGPVSGRPAHADADRDVLVAGARVGSQQNLRALELARRMLAAAQERREFAALGLAEFDAVAYIHLCLLAVRGTNERLNRMSGVWRPQKFTPKQGQYLAFIYAYTRLHRRPKPTCSNISGSAHLQFTRWCSRSNGQGSFGGNRGSLATSKSSLIRSTCQFYADL